jgi:hypothetical protein
MQPFDHAQDPTSKPAELQQWCAEFRDRLRAMVHVRLDLRLAPRFDPSDVPAW